MDSFLGNTRPFFQGLPASTRGYDGPTLEDQTHAPPTPTPPATPTLPPAHVYHPYPHSGGVTGAVPATSLPGLLPPSRPITPATPSHKPPDHTQAAAPYSVPSFLQPHPTKTSSNEARCLSQFEHLRQAALTAPTRPSNPPHDPRPPARPYSNQPSHIIDPRFPARPYGTHSTVSTESRTLPRPCTTQAPSSVELRPNRPYSTQSGIKADSRTPARPYSTQSAPASDFRTHSHPFSPQLLASDLRSQLDSKYPPRNEVRSDLRTLETRSGPRTDFRDEPWGQLYRVPEAKTLGRLAPSVHNATTPISVNGSKDALYLGKKSEDITSVRSDDPFNGRTIETLQVNGSRDPLYPNGSHTSYSTDTKRESSTERQAESRPKEDSALDLSVKTLRQTPDLTASDPDKTFNIAPLSGVTIERISQSDHLKCTPSSTPVTSPSKLNKDPSTTQVDLPKVAPGISGTLSATPPYHIASPYGVNGSPSPLPSSSPQTRTCLMLPATKRAGDPAYLENFTKLPRRSHTPPTKPTTPSRQLGEAHLPVYLQGRSLYSGHKDSISEQNRGLHLLAAATLKNEDDTRYGRESVTDRRQPVIDRKDSGNEWRDVSLERRVGRDPDLARRDVIYERKDLSLERRDPNMERRDPNIERRDPSLERRDPIHERRDQNLDRRELSLEKWDLNSVMDPKYIHTRHSDAFDSFRAWANASEQSKTNSDKAKYLSGQYPVPTSVPTTLPQQGSRVPPAQPPHPYSSYGRPPDTRLPQTPYSQSAHTVSSAHHSQVSVAPSSQGKVHQSYVQPATSRTPQASASHSSSHSSQHPVITSVTQSYHYSYTSNQAVAAHYQQQRHQQQRSATQYTPFNIPQTTKPAAVVSLPPPHLTPQQAAHQAYIYAQQRNEASHALYPTKRSNQMSPHPSGSPHPSISPHPSASPHPTASPHPSASPHPVAASPRSGVSPHPSQQGRTPQLSPHPAQKLPTSSPVQHPSHNYPGSLPPSPYSGHQTYPPHSTSPSRPPSVVASLPHPSQPHPNHLSKSPATHTSQPPTTHPSQTHLNRPTEPHPVRLPQHMESHPSQGHHSQTHSQHSLSSQNHHPQAHSLQTHHFQAASPQTRPSHTNSSQIHHHQSHPSRAHQPHPVISQANSQPSQPSSYLSQVHPYTSQVPPHLSEPSQTSLHSSQAPPHSSQAPLHSSQASAHSSQAPAQSSQAPPHSSQAPTHSSQAPTHSSQAPTHSSQPPPHFPHIPPHPSHVSAYPSQTPTHPSNAPPSNSQIPPHPSQASSHPSRASLHPSQAPTLSTEAASHPFLAPPHFSQAPSHTSQAALHSSHAPPHPSQVSLHPQVAPHPSHSHPSHAHPHQAPSHPSQAHPYLHSYPRVSQSHPQPSPALPHSPYLSHPSQVLAHPSQAPPHPSQAPPHPPQAAPHSSHVASHPSQASSHPPHTPHTSPHPSHVSSHSSHASSNPTQASPHPSQVPPHPSQTLPHPSQTPCHPSQAPSQPSQAPTYGQAPPHHSQSFSHTSQTHPHTSLPHSSQATTQSSDTSPHLSQNHSQPSHHIHPTHPHPSQPYPHPHPSQPYPHPHPSQPYLHPSQTHAHLNQAHVQPSQSQSSRAHHSHPHASQMHLPQAQLGHPMYPSHQTAIQQTSQPHSSHSSHKHPSHPSQPHPSQPHPPQVHHPQHTQRLHYQPPRPPHPSVKTENVPGSSQYPGYMYPSSFPGARPDMGPARSQLEPATQQPEVSSTNTRIPQDHDLSRIRTKGEQKAFDPRSAESGESCINLKPWSNCSPSVQGIQPNPSSLDENLPYSGTKPPVQPFHGTDHHDGSKTATVFEFREEESNRFEQSQSASKMLEPGKAALAEKLHRKIQAESHESLVTKRENAPEPSETKKEELLEENEWDMGLSKFMEDLAANPDGVTSKKSKTLGRRYLQKVQIQQAIDNDLIVPPPSDIVEEEDESEPEPPVKFRGKFKSIKDKKIERLILTYASHSDESATEMIPDEDASDFEEELKREIRSKDKKRGHARKIAKGYISSGSETERKDKKKGIGRGKNKENKPNNKQDSDFSPSSISESESSSSSSSEDSDSEDSELEEVVRPRRKGKKTSDSEEEEEEEKKPKRRGRKWDSDSTESEEEIIPRRRTRRGYKSSSEGETYKATLKNKKRKKKQDSSDSEDMTMKIGRVKKKKWESDDDEEYIETRRGKKKGITGRKQQKKSRKEDSEEESEEGEISRKTRGMKKKFLDSKKSKRRKQITSVSTSSDSDETNERKDKKIFQKKKSSKRKIKKPAEDSSENSDIPTKKKNHSKSNLIVESDDSDDSKNNDTEEKSTGEQLEKEEGEENETNEKNAETTKEPNEEEEQEEETVELDDGIHVTELEPDSVIEKLRKIRNEELNREDVKEMTAWLNEVNSDIKKQIGNLQEMAFRHCWKKPQFGAGDDFLHGWQTDVKKYKELTARFPKKLCQAVKHQVAASPTKGMPKKGRDRESGKDSPLRQGSSSPAKNTRSKSGIIKTSMAVAEDDRLKVAARPEISSVMQRFFEKVLAETVSDCTKVGLASKKFNLGPFPAFGSQRIPTGLTPTPSVAPSMMASDDSDLDSLASLRTDLPASDSIPVSKRSIASSLLKKFGRKYKDKKLNLLCLNKPRSILEATNKPQLLPTPGMPTTEKDLEEMSPDQLKIATFFRKETVCNYRDNFEVIVTKNGINEFRPILYQSRTRNKTKQIQDAATVKSVFGTDIPPHLIKKAEAKKAKKPLKKAEKKDEVKTLAKGEGSPVPVSRASTPGGSVIAQGDDDEDSELRSERSESVLGELSVPRAAKRVRRKFRKFRSGFDYIRKKKKVKPDDEAAPSRKRLPVRRHVNWPEESRDVASEVRSWVVNKGLGETVLHKAARLQYHDVVVYCAESPDFDINVRDNAGYTPLHEACNRGHLDIAQVLCAHGAHVNAPGYKGMRPLHEAVENGHGELARLLLAYGADPALTTYAGQTCLALSADTQTTYLIEGYLADLKGRPGEMWHFSGPTRFLDPDDQGCDIFGNIPADEIVPSHQRLKSTDETDKENSPSQNEKTYDILTACGDVAQKINESVQRKSEKLSNCEESTSLKINLNPLVTQVTEVQDLVKKEEISTENDTENKESPKEVFEEKCIPPNDERRDSDSTAREENQDSECEEKWDSKKITIESSELPLLDVFQVDGRPHKYCLMLELLTLLKMTQAEFIISARTIETLELSLEEFESRAHSCILGSCSRAIVDTCSCVVLVRVTPTVEKLLGIETVKL